MRTVVVAVLVAASLALTGCQGPTTAAPTPVRSTDLTSSDGGFADDAVVGAVLAPGDDALAADLERGLDRAGFSPDVRVVPSSGAAAEQARAVDTLVRAGAKALLVHAVDADALAEAVQTAHDAGVVVVSVGASVPASGTGGDGVSADHRVPAAADAGTTARAAVEVVRSLQRGEQPDTGDRRGRSGAGD
ncbi:MULTISPECIES: substrate-binding domain-containing protein [unclassified Curtobacterium]|uniref:substrate-binding domain-containing protein n=1 Tax=unclassified Curtobacterium TaxID=257496 RepID=UPI002881DB1D|nr:substrate-binding domain-containing protein [Curtobacterium sp. BRD11]MDT0211292.1 substrate-binding domain-containing protein [Curtobacterium sp. BRD11]